MYQVPGSTPPTSRSSVPPSFFGAAELPLRLGSEGISRELAELEEETVPESELPESELPDSALIEACVASGMAEVVQAAREVSEPADLRAVSSVEFRIELNSINSSSCSV